MKASRFPDDSAGQETFQDRCGPARLVEQEHVPGAGNGLQLGVWDSPGEHAGVHERYGRIILAVQDKRRRLQARQP